MWLNSLNIVVFPLIYFTVNMGETCRMEILMFKIFISNLKELKRQFQLEQFFHLFVTNSLYHLLLLSYYMILPFFGGRFPST